MLFGLKVSLLSDSSLSCVETYFERFLKLLICYKNSVFRKKIKTMFWMQFSMDYRKQMGRSCFRQGRPMTTTSTTG